MKWRQYWKIICVTGREKCERKGEGRGGVIDVMKESKLKRADSSLVDILDTKFVIPMAFNEASRTCGFQ